LKSDGKEKDLKAVIVRTPGGLDRLEVVDLPDPGEPGRGEVRVRVHASSLNYHDFGVASGVLKAEDRRVLLSDAGGVVEAVGADVSDFAVGDHVVSCFFPRWLDGRPDMRDFSGVPGDGVDGYAREIVLRPASWFTHAPQHFTHVEAATLTTAGLTAWRALVVDAGLRAGDTILVLGSGGVSIFALQFAKAMGARVIATSSSDEKLARFRTLGADHTINYKAEPKWGTAVRDWTGGRGVDHVIEVGGPGTLAQSIAAASVNGHISLIGTLTGRAGEIPTALLMVKQIRLQGLIVGSRRHQLDMIRALDSTRLKPVIDKTFSLAMLAEAFRYEASGAHFGKIGVVI
jgi:NADPH:quinone reductase-like Zn-dependent oxidoreductase